MEVSGASMRAIDTLLAPMVPTRPSSPLPPATPSAPPPLATEGSPSSFASRLSNASSVAEGLSSAVMMGGVAERVAAGVVSATPTEVGRSTPVDSRAPGRSGLGSSAAVRAEPLGQTIGADAVGEVVSNPVASSSAAVAATRHPAGPSLAAGLGLAGPPTRLPRHGPESGASARATSTLVTGGAASSSVTAESVLREAIALPAGERVLFFNDLRLHLHREGLLSVRNRAGKRQRLHGPRGTIGAPASASVPLGAQEGNLVGSAPIESAPPPPMTYSATLSSTRPITGSSLMSESRSHGLPEDDLVDDISDLSPDSR